jgi:hypothetical protein
LNTCTGPYWAIKLTTILSGLLFHPSSNCRPMEKETGNYPTPVARVSDMTDP